MVSDAEGHSSKKNDLLGIRRPTWELPAKKATILLKSKNLEKEMPFLRKNKSQGLEKYASSTPPNRSERDKDSKSRFYIWGNEGSRRRREDNGIRVTTREPKKAEIGPEKADPKRKRMTARDYLAQFKRRRIHDLVSSSCHNQSTHGQGGGVRMLGGCSFSSKAKAEEGDEQKTPHEFLRSEIAKLCRILQLSEDAALATRRLLEYILQNRRVHCDSPAIMHAFQLSLCWAGASISKQKVDKRESIASANKLLNYECTEKQAISVYSKIQSLKQMYLQRSTSISNSDRNVLSPEDFSKDSPGTEQIRALFPSPKEKSGRVKARENSSKGKHGVGHEDRNRKMKENARLLDEIKQKHAAEIPEFLRAWEEKRCQLEEDYKLESAVIRCVYTHQGSVRLRMEKLKILEDDFSKKIEEHNLLKNVKLENPKAQQQLASESEIDTDDSQSRAHIHKVGSTENDSSALSQHLEAQNENDILRAHAPSNNTNASEEACKHFSPENSSNLVNVDNCGPKSSKEIPDDVESSSTKESQKKFGGEEMAASACDLANQKVPSDTVSDRSSVPSAEPLMPPQQVPQHVLLQDSVPAALQGQIASKQENQSTSSPGKNFETINSVPSADETVVVPLLASNDETISHDNDHTTEPESTGNAAQEPIPPQHGEHLEQNYSPVLESGNIIILPRGQNLESSSSQATEPVFIESSISRNHNAEFGVQVGSHHGANNHFFAPPRANHASTFDPLQHALETMQRETELMKRRREDKELELKSQRDKEIQEILKTYEQKFQDAEAEFTVKKMGHLINLEKGRMNMILARTQRNLTLNPHDFFHTQRQVFQYQQQQRQRELAMHGSMGPNHRTTPSHPPGPSQRNPIPAPRAAYHQQFQPHRSYLSQNLVPPPPPPNMQSLVQYLAAGARYGTTGQRFYTSPRP